MTSFNLPLYAVIILLMLSTVICIFIIVVKIGQDGTKCTLNPLEFGVTKLIEANEGKEILCSCNLLIDGEAPTLWFTNNKTWFEVEENHQATINYSVLNITPG